MNEKMLFYIDCLMNVQLNRLRKANEELSLLKHWLIHFDRMEEYHQELVIEELYKKIVSRNLFKNVKLDELITSIKNKDNIK